MTPEEAASKLTPQMKLALTTWCSEGVVHSDTEDATKRGLVTRGLGVWASGQRVELNELGKQVRKVLLRAAMFARREVAIAEHPEALTAGELAPFMGEHEREYWEWTLDRLAQDMNAAGLPQLSSEREETG